MQLLTLLPFVSLAFAQSPSSTASSTASSASALQTVTVGEFGLRFTPEVIEAPAGGKIVFKFFPAAHSITQGDFSSPCQPASSGFNSGFVKVANANSTQTFTIDITNTDPIFFYCAQARHCQSGMVGVINPR
jgi:plastocyanin